ncbi:acylphosphatase [Treponema sp. HNW]|uniref:acylphosphatase n=1 Tax=Treponema sp. HNW TaxID=3116654 RepID=UPI003D0A5888
MEKTMSGKKALRIRIRGRVQGVGFRYWTLLLARRLNIKGEVRNLSDYSVQVCAEADERILEHFISQLREGPPHARVDKLIAEPVNLSDYADFTIEG